MRGRFAILLGLGLLTCGRWAAAAATAVPTTVTYQNATATSVGVAGEFSNWKVLALSKAATGHWSLTLALPPGSYGYKLVVDDKDWILDPANPRRKTVNDIENSALIVGDAPAAELPPTDKVPVAFQFTDPNAQSVHLAGEFNAWLHNVDGKISGQDDWQLHKGEGGTWSITVPLKPGQYEYKFVVNGGERWETDPTQSKADNGNSVVHVTPPAAPETQVTFNLDAPAAQAVSVAGDFNQWHTSATPLQKNEAGHWTVTVPLKPGRYAYKFVVDGEWKQDPANSESAPDGLGGANSVKSVGP